MKRIIDLTADFHTTAKAGRMERLKWHRYNLNKNEKFHDSKKCDNN